MVSRHYYYCSKCKERLEKPIVNSKDAEIAELKKKLAELEKELAQKKREEAEQNLWESGLEDLCYHLGY
jgi:transcription initiation factor IIE alpha subunit